VKKELTHSFEGALPEGWGLATIGDLIAPKGIFKDGDWVESKDQDPNGDVRLLQLADIGDGTYKNKSSRFLTREKARELNCTFLNKGDVLIARMPDPLGRACIFPGDNKECVTVVDVCIVRTGTDDIDHKWLMYWVNSPRFRSAIASLQSGTTRRRISRGNLATITLPFPPPEQQKRIVAKIEELFPHIDAAIEALKKAKQLLKQYRQSVLKAAVTGELTKEWREQNKDKLEPASQLLETVALERKNAHRKRLLEWESEVLRWKEKGQKEKKPPKPKIPKEISDPASDVVSRLKLPDTWSVLKLGSFPVDVFDGPFGSNLKSSDYVDQGIRVVRLENIGSLSFNDDKQTFITEEKYLDLKKHTVSSGDIIFSSFVADGTRVTVLPDNIKQAINKADCFCVRAYGSSINKDYLAQFLATDLAYKSLENEIHGATRPRVNTTQLKSLDIPFCGQKEQEEIVHQVEKRLSAIERLENNISSEEAKTENLKQSILAKAFYGDLVASFAGDFPAKDLLESLSEPSNEKPSKAFSSPNRSASRNAVLKNEDFGMKTNDFRRLVLDYGGEMTIEELFKKSGFTHKEIEEFYDELKRQVSEQSIIVDEPSGEPVKVRG